MTSTITPATCPFCGDVPEVQPWHGGLPTKHMVHCYNSNCEVEPMVSGDTLEEAVRRWNTRHLGETAQPVAVPDGWLTGDTLTPEEAWMILCETPDITSPEEYPDHALITMEQLRGFMERATPSLAPEGK